VGAPEDRSDAELIAAANAGDARAFEILYRRYRAWVLRLACRFTGDADTALDVLQDAFLYLLRKFPGFQLSARLTTFLYPAVKHLALTRRRQRRAQLLQDADAAELAATATDSDPGGAAPSAAEHPLTAILANLPPAHREVVLMRFVDDLPLAEIATALGVPLGTVKSRLHHAITALRADPRTRHYFDA